MDKPKRYLILPARRLQATAGNASAEARGFLINLAGNGAATLRTRLQKTVTAGARAAAGAGKKLKAEKVPKSAFEVVASLNEDGVKLVSATPEMMAAMRFDQPGLRVVPEAFCSPARVVMRLRKKVKQTAAGVAAVQRKLKITVIRSDTQQPVSGVDVIGFTNFA